MKEKKTIKQVKIRLIIKDQLKMKPISKVLFDLLLLFYIAQYKNQILGNGGQQLILQKFIDEPIRLELNSSAFARLHYC